MGARGPAPLPASTLKQIGSYRADRHGDRGEPVEVTGEPFEPHELSEEAATLWDVVVPQLTALGIATSLDSFVLAAMCEWYGQWVRLQRQIDAAGEVDPRLQRAAGHAYRLFEATARKFGLNPIDRQRLAISPPRDDHDDGFASLLA